MTPQTFLGHLKNATDSAKSLTEGFCFNSFPPQVKFSVRLNCEQVSNHLDAFELKQLEEVRSKAGLELGLNEVVDLLCKNERVPVWINLSIIKVRKEFCTVELLISRRYKASEEELYHLPEGYPPFHALVYHPPYFQEGEKFDVNWRNQTWRLTCERWKFRFKVFFGLRLP